MVKKISGAAFSEVEASQLALIDFSAGWCGPCQMLAPVLEEVSENWQGKVDFFNVDVDDNQDLAMRFGISSIPALIVLKEGKVVDQAIGFQPKPALEAFIGKQVS